MSEALKAIRQAIEQEVLGLHTCTIARVRAFDPETMLASVKPLIQAKDTDGEGVSLPVIERVPVVAFRAGGFIIRPPLEKGDIVLVVFTERSMDDVLIAGREETPGHTRDHALEDAIVVGGLLTLADDPLPADHPDDLVVASEDFSSRIVLQANGDVLIEPSGGILLGAGADEGVALGDALKTWLDGHTHDYTWTDAAGSGTTDSPGTASPDPSTKVEVEG